MLFPEIVLASNNPGKLKEFNAFFKPYNISIVPQNHYNVPECEEPYHTFIENALAKARHASRISGKPALADDSGICVSALNGAPGVHSARFAGEPKSDQNNNDKLSSVLENEPNKEVWYACVLVLVRHPDDPFPIITDGIWHGQWQTEAIGENGFGYDPHFFIPEYKQTAAEMASSLKNKISHRGRAMMRLMQYLDELHERANLPIPEEVYYHHLDK